MQKSAAEVETLSWKSRIQIEVASEVKLCRRGHGQKGRRGSASGVVMKMQRCSDAQMLAQIKLHPRYRCVNATLLPQAQTPSTTVITPNMIGWQSPYPLFSP
jgi:hypothetical protein